MTQAAAGQDTGARRPPDHRVGRERGRPAACKAGDGHGRLSQRGARDPREHDQTRRALAGISPWRGEAALSRPDTRARPLSKHDVKAGDQQAAGPGGSREIPMTTQVAKQAQGRARRPAVPAGVPILAAKITVPGVPDWAVPRPRITKLIAQGRRRCPLTVLTAPAGAGKTMALALSAAAEPGTVAWVGLDEFDSRPGVFWAYVVAALRRSGVAVPAAFPTARGRDAATSSCCGWRRRWRPRTSR